MYRRLFSDLGLRENATLDQDGDGTITAAVNSRRMGPVTLEFHFEPSGEGRITRVGIELGGSGGEQEEDEPALPPIEIPAAGVDPTTLASLVDGWLSRLAAADVFSGVVLLARNGNPVFERPYGLAERRFAAPVTTTTRFNIGSITKAFTTVVVAQLAAAGSLDLDAPLERYLPDYPNPEAARRMTIRQLVEHSSGLGDIFGDAFLNASNHRFQAAQEFFALFVEQPLLFEPGEGRAYSNAGFVVLGAVIEAITGENYRDSIKKRVFGPAGMTGSGFFASDGLEPDVAVGYTAGDCPEASPCRSNLATKVWAGCPAGGSSSPALDLLRFDEALRSHRLTSPEWTRWVMARIDPIEGGPADSNRASWSWAIAGGAPGVNAELDSDGRNTVVVMANLDPPIAMEIAKALQPVLQALEP
jgi:CubicO group peptidase (beta-lactamase class C family)